jgi:hypothetical protein
MRNFLRSKTNIMAIITIGTAIAKAFGVLIPTEILIGEGGLIALFMRMGILKLDKKLDPPSL